MRSTRSALTIAAAAAALLAMSGCVMVPPRHAEVVSSAPVYVAPLYESPGVGWVWSYHPRYGWGWHHSMYGWHRGWL